LLLLLAEDEFSAFTDFSAKHSGKGRKIIFCLKKTMNVFCVGWQWGIFLREFSIVDLGAPLNSTNLQPSFDGYKFRQIYFLRSTMVGCWHDVEEDMGATSPSQCEEQRIQ
jgi:hypothetical protein